MKQTGETSSNKRLPVTSEQLRFKAMLLKYPSLRPFWNFLTGECDTNTLRAQLTNLPFDEREMARFFVTVWQPGNELEFDIMQAMWKLGDEHWRVIEQWMSTIEQPEVSRRMMRSTHSQDVPVNHP